MKLVRNLLISSFVSFLIGFTLLSYPAVALGWNIVFPNTSAELAKVLSKPITTNQTKTLNSNSKLSLPEKDLSLPLETWVNVPAIGVSTQINEASIESYEDALKKGVWRVPNFGTPTEVESPIILVAHRFGYLNWGQEYREENSFFNLPDLSEGDRIEIIWDQRKFVYEVYLSEDGEEISNYNTDLILYTCRFLKSNIRIFKYAKRIL